MKQVRATDRIGLAARDTNRRSGGTSTGGVSISGLRGRQV